MNNVIDEVLAGAPRYNIKDNGGTTLYSNVQIDLATQVNTVGTPLNKALFDSIQSDLNTRLLISNKATTAEAQAGTNDTKYTTPAKVQDKLNALVSTVTQSGAGTYTICTFSNYTNAKVIRIMGKTKMGSSSSKYIVNGTAVGGFNGTSTFSDSSSLSLTGASNSGIQGFEFTFDLLSKSFTGIYASSENNRADIFCGRFTAITNFQIQLVGAGSSLDVTIQTNS